MRDASIRRVTLEASTRTTFDPIRWATSSPALIQRRTVFVVTRNVRATSSTERNSVPFGPYA